MTMELTNAQKRCVDERDCTLLVSAGAGSGKTSVLTQRLIKRLTDKNDECEIDNVLVVTFTKAAASELKSRLGDALKEALRNDPSNKKTQRQLAKLSLAKISTINAFCKSLVDENFQLLSLPPKNRILDDSEATMMRGEILLSLFEDRYESEPENSAFFRIVELFAGPKNDKLLIEKTDKLYCKLRNYPEPFLWLEKTRDLIREVITEEDFFKTAYGTEIKRELDRVCRTCISLTERSIALIPDDDADLKKAYGEVLSSDLEFFKDLASGNQSYPCMREKYTKYEPGRFKGYRNGKNPDIAEKIKNNHDKVRDLAKKAFAGFDFSDDVTVRNCAKEYDGLVGAVYDILSEFDRRYSEKKRARACMDFADSEQFALKLLVGDTGLYGGTFSKTDLARELSEKFTEIYIDEYQDVNPTQDVIFRALCREDENGVEYNRFMVGDVKQSIYRFRGARPELFNTYRADFSKISEASDEKRHKIFLSDNFRCCENIIDSVNCVFSYLFGKDYLSDEQLIYSKKETQKNGSSVELIAVPDEIYDGDERFSESDCEMRTVANKILEIVGNKEYLNCEGQEYSFGDVAVLLRKNEDVERYKRYLYSVGIPTQDAHSCSFFEKKEILLMLCFIFAVDNPQRDIYTAGLMRSPIYLFTDNELLYIKMHTRKNPNAEGSRTSFYSEVIAFAESDDENTELKEKAAFFINDLSKYRTMSRGTPTDRLIMNFYEAKGVVNLCIGAYGNDAKVYESLLKFYETAREYEKSSYRSVCSFASYLEGRISGKDESKSEKSDLDLVKVMSIHNSKGLEFPICFVAELSRDISKSSEKDDLLVSDTLGIGMKIRDFAGNCFCSTDTGLLVYDTPFRRAISISEHSLDMAEEKRVLYVAMTRARERLFMSMRIKDTDKLCEPSEISFGDDVGKISQWLLSVACSEKNVCKNVCMKFGKAMPDNDRLKEGVMELTLACKDDIIFNKQKRDTAKKDPAESEAQIDRERLDLILSQSGEIDPLSQVPSKISVSRLKIGLVENENENIENAEIPERKTPRFIGDDESDGAARGTAMHMFMQFANFKECENAGTRDESQRLAHLGFITDAQADMLDHNELSAFFASRLYSRIKESKNVRREMRFDLKYPASKLASGSPDGEFMLVQGVIDCFFENADGTFSVVDFKTDRVGRGDGEEILKNRHSAQLFYYCDAVEEMTGRKVTGAYLYSFCLGKEIEVKRG